MTRLTSQYDTAHITSMQQSGYHRGMEKQNSFMENGILFVLRVFLYVQFTLVMLTAIDHLFNTHRQNIQNTPQVVSMQLIWITVLLIMVTIQPVIQALNRYFIPMFVILTVAQAYVTLMATMFDAVVINIEPEVAVSVRAAQVIILLFVPLIVVAWQYSYKAVNIFIGSNVFLMAGFTIQLLEDFSILMVSLVIFQMTMYLIVGHMVAWLMSIQRRQRRDLIEANEKVRRYAITLEQLAISRERNRLARELHDTLAHTLSGLSVQLEATDALLDREPERARRLLQDALKSARSGMVDTRQALHALRAAPLEDLGLILSLETMANDITSRGGVKIDCHFPEQLPNLSIGVDHVIYRVIQEGLTNIVRHAEAQHVTVSITPDEEKIFIEIIDDGIGFDVNAVETEHHFGVQGMRERVSMIGGEMTLTSQHGQGTTIKIMLGTTS